ncbi:MAG: ABC transporter substrate-binding protein [Burkholderiales bacterium]
MSTSQSLKVPMLLGDYPVTAALKKGDIRSDIVSLQYPDVKAPSTAFKRVVRNLEFDCAELAIVTFLMAKAHGKPLVLLPAVVVGRFQHPYIVYNAERGVLGPRDLNGKRIGIRSYSVTTVTWLRGILANGFGLDIDSVKWVTFEEPHVAEFRDPPTVQRAAEGKDLVNMLLAGEIDAAIVGDRVPADPRLKTLFPDPDAEARAWQLKNNALQINHMVVVKDAFSISNPNAVREIYRMLKESKRAAGLPKAGELDANPFGVEANRRNLEIVIDYVHQQRLIPRRYAVDELFDDLTRTFD